jgi:predicted HD superfamily hydrolase involved in NAD metabolism
VDQEQAALAMLAHDVARAMPGSDLLRLAFQMGLPIGVCEQAVPLLLHGPVGAELLARGDGLCDQSIYQAVYWHTTAHPALDALGKVVFLADKLDPQKLAAYPYQADLWGWAMEDLDRAILEFLTRETISLSTRAMLVHPMAIETRNHLLVR